MIKKRRNNINKVISLTIKKDGLLAPLISKCTYNIKDEGVVVNEYEVLSTYGKGLIKTYCFFGVELSISDFKLDNDIMLTYNIDYNKLQLSFLLIGEKIISLKETEKDIICESGECYMANIDKMEGKVRISSRKRYKEVKIRIASGFFELMHINDPVAYNKLSNVKHLTPITNEIFNVLRELENNNLRGINRRIFLKIKVLELLVIQRENYIKLRANSSLNQKNELVKHLYTIKQYILDNIDEKFSIKELASTVGLNDSTLKKEFKRIFGNSISEFYRNEKMKYAQNALKNTELTIYQIAEEIGYKNATHFTAAFKKNVGVTPKMYRLKH